MIKIGTKKDLSKISHLPMNIQNAICEDVGILDNFYGDNRNIDVDMGGFVVVCDKDEKLDIILICFIYWSDSILQITICFYTISNYFSVPCVY